MKPIFVIFLLSFLFASCEPQKPETTEEILIDTNLVETNVESETIEISSEKDKVNTSK
jgi:uncharacterized protein YcfL